MSKTIEFFWDPASTYSYLAATQMETFAAQHGATVVWKPFLLGKAFEATGNKMPLTGETARLTVGNARAGGLQSVDQGSAAEAFDFPSRSVTETLADTINWMHTAGHLTADQAGLLAT